MAKQADKARQTGSEAQTTGVGLTPQIKMILVAFYASRERTMLLRSIWVLSPWSAPPLMDRLSSTHGTNHFMTLLS